MAVMADEKRKATRNKPIVHLKLYTASSKSRGSQQNDALNQVMHLSKCALRHYFTKTLISTQARIHNFQSTGSYIENTECFPELMNDSVLPQNFPSLQMKTT
ncbi:hypothetical protein T12_9529 [Trichinella patagoniensis]|uniref:Uncharacterized protein n=1 Tax=Trichinella patagoniensis TaxID=990121 RepID=A0A0V1A6M7_9BILA|nr:hypothetical protein T12_15840 [Trichinella patagoniensis]KRY20461.1 hypothetical protein T12_9529 [Trichinella patagoniensis]